MNPVALTELAAVAVAAPAHTVAGGLWKSALIILGSLAVLLAGRVLIRRMLSMVAEAPGLVRLVGSKGRAGTVPSRSAVRRERRTDTVASLLNNALTIVVSVVAVLMLLDVWGFPAGPLLTSVGIVGIAVAFGFQQVFRDYLAGIFITVEDQFGIGDLIETSEVKGRVRAMSLRITTVESEDGAVWYLRNGEILRVANHSQGVTTTSLPLQEARTGSHAEASAPATPASDAPTAATTRITRVGDPDHNPAPRPTAAASDAQAAVGPSADAKTRHQAPAQKETE
ncbi:mechanosensitive ion channel family protein [Falsarthrobacter nasiphocae]|uniref:Small conductance mechanosensitive channel n=1 Tax=Falsarthrobacter nasiphocae TaxID=189863 RepID=A0AAE3YFK4_9MICC|nr:mechanosensitive ion channel domain-containing protein [Falsarthrobacter nasiphocae]MDR6892908.1 small conductance mechanosensitive channel [Falsarthrobacter nasiphocae]